MRGSRRPVICEEHMDDLIWFIFIGALFVLLGFVFIRIGLAIWKKQKMELIIRSH